jgi:hypothetical protein
MVGSRTPGQLRTQTGCCGGMIATAEETGREPRNRPPRRVATQPASVTPPRWTRTCPAWPPGAQDRSAGRPRHREALWPLAVTRRAARAHVAATWLLLRGVSNAAEVPPGGRPRIQARNDHPWVGRPSFQRPRRPPARLCCRSCCATPLHPAAAAPAATPRRWTARAAWEERQRALALAAATLVPCRPPVQKQPRALNPHRRDATAAL